MKFPRRLFLEPLESRDLLSCPPVTWLPSTAMTAMMSEQAYAADKLVPLGSVTDIEIGGLWSDPHSWASGHTPGAGAVIDVTGAAIYDLVSSPSYKSIRVDGSFADDMSKDESLLVETMVDEPTGTVTILEPDPTKHFVLTFADNGPMDAVADPKEMGRGFIAVGIMNPDGTMGAMAKTDIEGASKTAFVTMQNAFGGTAAPAPIPQTWHIDIPATPLPAGTYTVKLHIKGSDITEVDGTFTVLVDGGTVTSLDITQVLPPAPPSASQQITVTQPITGWQVGDQLLLPGTFATSDSSLYKDDVRTITSINGQVITLDRPLTYDHVAPAGQSVYVADLSRNIKIQSANVSGDPQRNGHIMFMHTDNETLSYFEMDGLGRTDKSKALNNSVLDSSGQLVAGTGTNNVGRYALHFHRLYNYDSSCLVTVTGVVDTGSPGWGFVNHSSNVNFTDNIAYKAFGAGFAAEAGDEIGSFTHNMAVHEIGRIRADSGLFDGGNGGLGMNNLGTMGDGYWEQSGYGVTQEKNISTEAPQAGYFVYGFNGLNEPGFPGYVNETKPRGGEGTQFLKANLLDQSILADNLGKYTPVGPLVSVLNLPLEDFTGNLSIADTTGFFHSWMHTTDAHRGVVKDFTAWNTITGINLGFTDHEDIVNATLLGSDTINPLDSGGDGGMRNYGVKIVTGYGASDSFYNLDIEHFGTGIQIPKLGVIGLHGGYFNNATNIAIEAAFGRVLTIDGTVTFAAYDRLNGRQQFNYYLAPLQTTPPATYNLNTYLMPNTILLNTTDDPASELWYQQAAADYNPWNTTYVNAKDLANMPPELAVTNGQAQAQFGNGGFLGQSAPVDAVAMAYSNGLISKAIVPPPNWSLNTYTTYFNKPDVSLYVFVDKGLPTQSSFTAPVHLNHQDWNEVRVDHNGQSYGFLVYLFSGPATVTVAPNQVLTVAMADLAKPFILNYTVDAGLFIQQNLHPTINLAALPIQTRADGTRYVTAELKGTDAAGNVFDVFEDITVTP